jgi:putative pyruvate formate lyase activating enzyme
VDRLAGIPGYCRVDASVHIAAIVRHRGEEPAISGGAGICNVFFAHCNLRCRFCQNAQISRNESVVRAAARTVAEAAERICRLLEQGVDRLGFVSPSHQLPQMAALIAAVRDRGHRPVIVYNSNGYDRVESLRELEDLVDVYLPDFKYADSQLAARWSGAGDYPEVALAALGEMYRQRGNVLHLDGHGLAERGLIVRHLVLPGSVDNSVRALELLAEHLSPRLTLSLMAQYNPTPEVAAEPPLNRRLRPEEYARVVAAMERLGFTSGWVQELGSADCYNPDFDQAEPFADPAASWPDSGGSGRKR